MIKKIIIPAIVLTVCHLFAINTYAQVPCTISGGVQASVVNIDSEELLISFSPNSTRVKGVKGGWAPACSRAQLIKDLDITVTGTIDELGLEVWKIRADLMDILGVMDFLRTQPCVESVQPNFLYTIDATPNDPGYSIFQTNLQGDGCNSIGAEAAWNVRTGDANRVVGVLDTGIDWQHPDLAANMWVNTAELNGTTGVDDDGNGYIDDIHGYNFADDNANPYDDYTDAEGDNVGHGTHMAGIIGAVGNNGIGISGINWDVQLMALKCFDNNGVGRTSDIVQAIYYSLDKGVQLTNNSWGGVECDGALYLAIEDAGDAGQLFVTSAGNGSNDIDANDYLPAGYGLDNIMTVMASDDADQASSNHGATKVDIAAPGVGIASTAPINSYRIGSGASMATAHVTGAAVLVWAENLSDSNLTVKDKIMCRADYSDDLDNASSGRLDVGNVVDYGSHIDFNIVFDCDSEATVNVSYDARSCNALGGGLGSLNNLNSNSFSVASHSWDFGNGQTSNNENGTGYFSASGATSICLDITDQCGYTSTLCKTKNIDVPELELDYETTAPYMFGSYRTNVYLCGGTAPFSYAWLYGSGQHAIIDQRHYRVQHNNSSAFSFRLIDSEGRVFEYVYDPALAKTTGEGGSFEEVTVNASELEQVNTSELEQDGDKNTTLNNATKTELASNLSYKLYPNPAHNVFNLEYDLKNSGMVSAVLFDASGRAIDQLINDTQLAGKQNHQFDIQDLKSGVYFIKVNTPDGQFSQKLSRL